MSASMFQKATKRTARARVALDGPSGAGKTWTALEWATVLADGGKIALVDTERGSASLYASHFDFDVLEMSPPYETKRLEEALRAAEAGGYAVVVIDSWTHFWSGEGGVLDEVDKASARTGGNKFAAWQHGTPLFKRMVDTILGLDAHVIVTMRSKTEWVIEENEHGKKQPRRIGMAPEQRAGVEYEFTMVGDLDLGHRLVFSKSRCDRLSDAVIEPGEAAAAAQVFKGWLEDGDPLASRNEVDALTSRMNALPDDMRKACKTAFVEAFGRPDSLPASKVAEASALVASFEQAPPPDGGTKADGGGGESDVSSDAETEGGGPSAQEAPPSDLDTARARTDLMKTCSKAFPETNARKGTKTRRQNLLRHAAMFVVLGEHRSANDCNIDELYKVERWVYRNVIDQGATVHATFTIRDDDTVAVAFNGQTIDVPPMAESAAA